MLMKNKWWTKFHIVFFNGCSFFLYLILKNIHIYQGIFDDNFFLNFKHEKIALIGLFIVSMAVLLLRKNFFYFFIFYHFFIISKLMVLAIVNFDKVLAISITTYLFFILLFIKGIKKETESALSNFLFTGLEIGPNFFPPIYCELINEKNKKNCHGIILNWDHEGFFVALQSEDLKEKNILPLRIYWKGYEIYLRGKIVYRSLRPLGLGISFIDSELEQKESWEKFFQFINDLGLKPQYI